MSQSSTAARKRYKSPKEKKSLLKRKLAQTQGWKCFYCKCNLIPEDFSYTRLESDLSLIFPDGSKSFRLHVDHMQPKSKGGNNKIENLCLSCAPCNMSKGNKTVIEFRNWRNAKI